MSGDTIDYNFDRCKICDGPIRTIRRKTNQPVIVARCGACGLEFVRELHIPKTRPLDDYEWLKKYYLEICAGTANKFIYGLDKIIDFNKKRGTKALAELTLLDVGCGGGEFLLLCKQKGINAHGVEMNENAIRLCKERGLDNVHVKDIGDITETFDIITLFDVAEHLEEPLEFFRKVSKRLNPGGIIYIETPRKNVIDFYLHVLSMFSSVKSNRISFEHVQLFSDESLRLLLDKCGLKIVSFERKQSLSWTDKKAYIRNIGITSEPMVFLIEKAAQVAIDLRLFGQNKAILIAQRKPAS